MRRSVRVGVRVGVRGKVSGRIWAKGGYVPTTVTRLVRCDKRV